MSQIIDNRVDSGYISKKKQKVFGDDWMWGLKQREEAQKKKMARDTNL